MGPQPVRSRCAAGRSLRGNGRGQRGARHALVLSHNRCPSGRLSAARRDRAGVADSNGTSTVWRDIPAPELPRGADESRIFLRQRVSGSPVQQHMLVHGASRKGLAEAVGPMDDDGVVAINIAQTEMDSVVIASEVARRGTRDTMKPPAAG